MANIGISQSVSDLDHCNSYVDGWIFTILCDGDFAGIDYLNQTFFTKTLGTYSAPHKMDLYIVDLESIVN
jgi:hypothetical protein